LGRFCIKGSILLTLILFTFAGYAYRVNSKLKSNDPTKNGSLLGYFPMPFWPLITLAWIFFHPSRFNLWPDNSLVQFFACLLPKALPINMVG